MDYLDGGSSAPTAAASGGDEAAGAAFMDAEDERLLRNIGDHPLMERVQTALQKQLQARFDRVDEELRDRAEEAARTAKQREELGVELYGVQQQLAKLQMQLETTQGNAAVVAQARSQAEGDLASFKDVSCVATFRGRWRHTICRLCLLRAMLSARLRFRWRRETWKSF